MAIVVIAEKPSVAQDIAKVLGVTKKTDTHWDSDDLVITWAVGHLLELKTPEEYDDRLKDHMKFFRENGTSIVLKPKHLRKVRVFAKLPKKRNKDLEGLNKKQARVDPVTGKTYTY